MRKFLCCIFSLIALSASNLQSSAQTVMADRLWENLPGWRVFASAEYQGCVAIASYQDGTTVRLGYDGIVKDYFFNLSNLRWRSYPLMKDFELRFDLGRGRTLSGFFHMVTRDATPTFEIGNVKSSFLDDIAAALGIRVFDEDTQLASLSLGGSRRALNSMVECQQSILGD